MQTIYKMRAIIRDIGEKENFRKIMKFFIYLVVFFNQKICFAIYVEVSKLPQKRILTYLQSICTLFRLAAGLLLFFLEIVQDFYGHE